MFASFNFDELCDPKEFTRYLFQESENTGAVFLPAHYGICSNQVASEFEDDWIYTEAEPKVIEESLSTLNQIRAFKDLGRYRHVPWEIQGYIKSFEWETMEEVFTKRLIPLLKEDMPTKIILDGNLCRISLYCPTYFLITRRLSLGDPRIEMRLKMPSNHNRDLVLRMTSEPSFAYIDIIDGSITGVFAE